MEERDLKGLIRALDKNKKILITDLVNSRGFTLAHSAAFKNYEDIFMEVISRAK